MVEIFPGIWVGKALEAVSFVEGEMKAGDSPLFKPPIKAVLNVADDCFEIQKHSRRLTYIHAGLTDGPGNTLEEYLMAILSLDFLVTYRTHVLVHCWEGASRSCFIAGTYLSYKLSRSFNEVEEMMKRKYDRVNINKAHKEWLHRIQKGLSKFK